VKSVFVESYSMSSEITPSSSHNSSTINENSSQLITPSLSVSLDLKVLTRGVKTR
jgi:hypothetical protein